MSKQAICPNCDGSLKDIDGNECKDCNGTGRVEIFETVKGDNNYVKRSMRIHRR